MQTNHEIHNDREELEIAVFSVGNLLCGLDIAEVKEIDKNVDVTAVEPAPPYVAGIVNLRGQIVTVIHLRTRLGLEGSPAGSGGRHIVVNAGDELIGLTVDAVEDIILIDRAQMHPAPPNMKPTLSRFVRGVIQRYDDLVLILDVQQLTRTEAADRLQEAATL